MVIGKMCLRYCLNLMFMSAELEAFRKHIGC